MMKQLIVFAVLLLAVLAKENDPTQENDYPCAQDQDFPNVIDMSEGIDKLYCEGYENTDVCCSQSSYDTLVSKDFTMKLGFVGFGGADDYHPLENCCYENLKRVICGWTCGASTSTFMNITDVEGQDYQNWIIHINLEVATYLHETCSHVSVPTVGNIGDKGIYGFWEDMFGSKSDSSYEPGPNNPVQSYLVLSEDAAYGYNPEVYDCSVSTPTLIYFGDEESNTEVTEAEISEEENQVSNEEESQVSNEEESQVSNEEESQVSNEEESQVSNENDNSGNPAEVLAVVFAAVYALFL
eukprot:TRINITY_DN119_c0_g1_i1.p1 TRINITY_DN119_c0_g1~~TRINITY_DN119_c0_g1_i1.p1  ORF type:complete len:297 (+),score=88.00 TRINITY_DN119_c0_g1_i1:54-944(+)